MKNVLKFFLFGIIICLGFVAFCFNDNVTSFLCHADNVSNTAVVNFYSADNETLLYSRQIEKGSTLNDIKSLNYINIPSDYNNYINSSYIYVTASSLNQNFTIYLENGLTGREMPLCNIEPITLKKNTHYYLSSYDSDGNLINLSDLIPGFRWNVTLFQNTLYNHVAYLNSSYSSVDIYLSEDTLVTGIGMYYGNSSVDFTGSFTFQLSLTNDIPYEPYYDNFNNFINKKYLASANIPVLPDSYQQVEYIESTGTQYINTGLSITSDFGFDVTAYIPSSCDGTLLGNYLPGNYLFFVYAYSNGTAKFFPSKNLSSIDLSISRNQITSFSFINGVFNDGVSSISVPTYATSEIGQPFYLFTGRTNGTFSSYKLCACKFYHGSTVVQDLVPCYRVVDGEIGLYDLLSDTFYSNSGTGTFLKGNNVNSSLSGFDVSWSISPTSNSKFSFASPINHDYNFYGFIEDGVTFNYVGELDSRLSEIGDYAISNIVSFNIDGYYLFEVDFDSSSSEFNFVFASNDISSVISNFPSSRWKSYYFNSSADYFDMNMFVVCPNSSGCLRTTINSTTGRYQYYLSKSSNVPCKVYFSNLSFSYGNSYDQFVLSNDNYSKSANYLFDTNLGSLVDMSSDTNYSYQLIYNDSIWQQHNSDTYLSYFLLSHFLEGFPFDSSGWNYRNPNYVPYNYFTESEDIEIEIYCNNGTNSYNFYNVSSYVNNFLFMNIYQPVTYDLSYNINNYYFVIDKPSYRVNNSLCIYNFDYYNTLSDVTSLTYELQKGSNYYDVTYTGTIDNKKFLYFDCSEIDNTIFDRYVFLYLTFNNSKINLVENDNYLSYSVGFDFNFIYYNQPLITSNGIYPYSFDIPKYKDMSITFSIVPPELVIPWNAIFYNAVVFLCFYMPLISDINNALGLNYFIGALLNIVDYIFSSAIGQFITGVIAFLILFSLVKSLIPIINRVRRNNYYAKH